MQTNYLQQEQAAVNQWLSDLGASQESLQLDQQGNCFLVADNEIGLIVSCAAGSQQVAVMTHLINVPIPLSAEIYEELLALNLNIEFMQGSQLFFDKKTRVLGLLVARDIATMDEISFRNLLNNFKEKALEARGFIESLLYGVSKDLSVSQQADLPQRGINLDGKFGMNP